MRFRWLSRLARRGFINSAAIRMINRKMDLEQAIRITLNNGEHCEHSELIPGEMLECLREDVMDKHAAIVKELEKGRTRREGKRPAG